MRFELEDLFNCSAPPTDHRSLELYELEGRVLLSAAPVAIVVEAMEFAPTDHFAPLTPGAAASRGSSHDPGASTNDSITLVDSGAAPVELPIADVSTSEGGPVDTRTLEVVVIDTSVEGYQQLVNDIIGSDNSQRQFEIVLLDQSTDGVDRIGASLTRFNGIDALHIVSHGTDGIIKLGSTWLTNGNLGAYAGQIAQWGNSLNSTADILFYGCDLASNADGIELVQSIAALTNAEVAASSDHTGSALLGGNWQLEYSAGPVESTIAFSSRAQAAWGGILSGVPPLITTTSVALPYTEGDGRVTVDTGLTITDGDDTDLVSGSVRITGNFTAPEDQLFFTDQNGITGSYDANTGILSLSGIASVTDYQAALRSVTFENTSVNPNTSLRSISFQASDGTGTSTAVRIINLLSVGPLAVDTTVDLADGDTTSISALTMNKGIDGKMSLREAITAANNTLGTDTVHFIIADSLIGGGHTIAATSALPLITEAMILDGTTEPDSGATPIIVINGAAAGASVNGLVLAAGSDGSTIRGLVINQFASDGIEINRSDNNTIEGNFLGTDVTGTADLGNGQDGVHLQNANGNTIGGTTVGTRNLISGNNDDGIGVNNSNNNTIIGNLIGTDLTGVLSLGNADSGIVIRAGSTGNTIGGITVAERNIVSANATHGIHLQDAGTSGNMILGNYIGTDISGSLGLGNAQKGVALQAGSTETWSVIRSRAAATSSRAMMQPACG